MRNFLDWKWISSTPLLLGILVFITPKWLVPVCTGYMELKNGALKPMVCFYSSQSVMVLGAILIVAGILTIFFKSNRSLLGIIIAVLGAAIIMILQPSVIGVCANEQMPCNITRDWLFAEAITVIICGLYLWRSNREVGKR